MSNYENNISGKLQQIYDIKNDIAEVIGTDSTDFSEYPELISEAISNGSGEGGGSVSQDGKYAFFHLTEESSPLGGFTAIPCTDFFDGQNTRVWENIEFYTGIYRTEDVIDPSTSELTLCNSYYSIEVRDSNYNLITMYSTCYDCGNPYYAIHLSGTLAADASLSFYLTWNHGVPEPDENDPSVIIGNWTQEDLGEIGFTPYNAESGSQSIMVVVSQDTGNYQVEGEIVSAKLYIQDSGAEEYHLQDEWEESE